MNPYLILFLALILSVFALDTAAELLNISHFAPEVPDEFRGLFDEAKYRQSQLYQRENTRFGILRSSVSTAALLAFLLLGGFEAVDRFARGIGWGLLGTALAFAGALSVLRLALQLPFTAYQTFVIEERYGFNRTTLPTFVGDLAKALLLGALLGGPAFAGLVWFFERAGSRAWLWAWIAFSAFQGFLVFIAPVVILPLFNKYRPVPVGPLRLAIEDYARRQRFELHGIFTMDGSRRSTKANAFFTGFGRFRRLVLFDTLIEKQTADELVAVLAHEVGHFKEKHIVKVMLLSIFSSGVMLWVLSRFINNPAIFETFRMTRVSVYASVIFVGILFSPVMRLVSIATSALSRHFEFEADRFSARTHGRPEDLVSALKKLSLDNLSHLTPHPLKVWLDYSHPPVLERIRALRSVQAASSSLSS